MELGFSNCLKELMNTVELKNSRLAKAINVDASLIYKWLNNKTVPPYYSTYIDLISNHIIKSIITTHQFNAVKELIKRYLPDCGQIDEINMPDFIKKMLLESQGYSIKKRKNINHNSINSNQESTVTNPSAFNQYTVHNEELVYSKTSSKIQIITGYNQVLNSVLELLEAASSINAAANDPILISLSGNMNWTPYLPDFDNRWIQSLSNALKNNWEITFLLRLNNDCARNTKIIEDILMPFLTDRNKVYYSSSVENQPPIDIIIVPRTGALFCLSSYDKNKIDSAFLIKNRNAIDIIKGYFYQVFASSKPLFKSSAALESMEFQKEYAETEEPLGRRSCLKAGLNTITIPLTLYEKYLKKSCVSHEELIRKMSYHERRIRSFESQVKNYKYREILSFDSIDYLIDKGEYSIFDNYYICNNIVLSKKDIADHLSSTIQLLKKYENYEIALVDMEQMESLTMTNWIVKENSSVYVITYVPEILNINGDIKRNNAAKCFTISEPNITKAFEVYFDNLWNHIEPQRKNKREVIKLLENKLKILHERQE